MPFNIATPVTVGSTTETQFKSACMTLKNYYLASTSVPTTYGDMRTSLNSINTAFGLSSLSDGASAATVATNLNALIDADTTWGTFLQSTDNADSQVKYPGVVADFRADRYGITRIATASIPAATAAQVGFPALAAFSDLFTFTRAGSAYYVASGGTYTSATTDTARFDYTNGSRQLLLEGASTNSIRNNSMQGAAAGTPGTAPTNWTVDGTENGLTRTIVGTGTENGVDYIDVRWAGTASASSNLDIFFESANSVAAANGQTWAMSYFAKLVAGTLPGTVTPFAYLYDSVPTFLTTIFSGTETITGTLTRFSRTATIANASTAFIRPALLIAYTNGAAVDFTIRIGWPQIEQASSASSPIRTTTTAVTRAADSCKLTAKALAVLARTAAGVVVQGRGLYNGVSGAGGRLVGGALTTRVLGFGNAGTSIFSGFTNALQLATVTTPLSSAGTAAGWDGSGQSGSHASGAIQTTALTMDATLSEAYLGRDATGGFVANGWYDRFVIYPFRPTNASLVSEAIAYA